MKASDVLTSIMPTRSCFMAVAIAVAVFSFPQFAHAGAISTVLCSVINMVMGTMGRALATLAIIVVGIGATLGKVSWGLALTVAVGIAVMLGAPNILLALTGLTSGC